MSYEGYDEYICENGHYYKINVHSKKELCCSCGAHWLWFHAVDQTNGYDENNPDTFKADKIEHGWTDIRNIDHYGNVYFTKQLVYKPYSIHWVNLSKI